MDKHTINSKALMQITPKDVKLAMQMLDNKYYNNITGLIGSYIEEYFSNMHPDTNQSEIDKRINLWANTWYVELTRNILCLEKLPEDSLDSGVFIDQ